MFLRSKKSRKSLFYDFLNFFQKIFSLTFCMFLSTCDDKIHKIMTFVTHEITSYSKQLLGFDMDARHYTSRSKVRGENNISLKGKDKLKDYHLWTMGVA